MMKIETVWDHILGSALLHRQFQLTQQEIAQTLGYSLSTVNHALAIPTEMGAIRKTAKYFILQDPKKLLLYWAGQRRLVKDVIFTTEVEIAVAEIEGLAPPGAVYGLYSAIKYMYGEPPADYAKVYLYVDEPGIAEMRRRYPDKKTRDPNVIGLKKRPEMLVEKGHTTLPQTYVDLWNVTDWYANDFIQFLNEKIDGLLS